MIASIAEYIDHLKKLYSANTDAELAATLGATKSSVANWRRRNTIPPRVQQRVLKDHGPGNALDYMLNAEWSIRTLDNVHSLALYVYERERQSGAFGEFPASLEWWGFLFEQTERALRKYINDHLPNLPSGRALIQAGIEAVDAGKILEIERLFGRRRD